jgi:hypothetical protein
MSREMNIVGVAMVKNEEDIIECFVRYHLSYLDGMLVLDNGSSDATAKILASLRREGLAIQLRYDPRVAYDQARLTTALAREAADALEADFVVILDADEFLRGRAGGDVRLALESALRGTDLAFVRWSTYVPDSRGEVEETDGLRADVLRRVPWRRRTEAVTVCKVIVSRALCLRPGFELRQGNHDVVRRPGESLPSGTAIDALSIAHFPVRSYEQARRKYLIGWLANLAREQPVLFDWALYYQRFKSEEVAPEDVPELAYFYNCADRTGDLDLVFDPVPVTPNLACTHNSWHTASTLGALLSHCERLARGSGGTEIVQTAATSPRVASALFDCCLAPATLSLAEAAALYRWITPVAPQQAVVVGASRNADDLAHALRTIADAADFTIRLVRIEGATDLRCVGGVESLDRLVIQGVDSFPSLRADYEAGVAALRPGGGLVLFDVIDTRSRAIRHLADTLVTGGARWSDHRLYERFLFATHSFKR